MFTQSQIHTNRLRLLGNAAALALLTAVVCRWWYYVDTYSVNLLVWDQWDLYDAFFAPHGWLDLFRWQHGPHRQGVGFFITKIVADLSGWNTRMESFAIGGIVFLSMLGALVLKMRLTTSLRWPDVTIALIFLTPLQWSIFASVPNPSHGAVPLLLLMCFCLGWTLRHPPTRYAAVLTLNLMLIYTGFGLVVGIITPALLAADLFVAFWHDGPHKLGAPIVRILISLVCGATFFMGYRFLPAAPGFRFPIAAHWQYPVFVTLMLANFWGIKGVGIVSFVTGTVTMMTMLAVCSFHIRHWVRRRLEVEVRNGNADVDRIVVVLTTFTLLFCILTAIGRVPLGLNTAQASRYVTYLIPGFFGIYLHLTSRTPQKGSPVLQLALIIGLIAATFPLPQVDAQTVSWLSQSKFRWKKYYLQTENIEESNRKARFMIYPDADRTHLQRKLMYLKTNRLNLFQDVSPMKRNEKSDP